MHTTQLTAQTARNRLDEIVRQEISAHQKATEALDLGTEYLDADFGYLAVTDEQFDYWNPLVSTDIPDSLPEHTLRNLSTTYCRRTTVADEQIALHDLPNQGLADDPGYRTFGCHCYLGTPLVVDGTQRGTVCFVSEEPRSEPFDDAELLFAELLARVLGYELKCERTEQQHRNQTNLTTVLNRVLRHNLRNNMTVIRGHTQVMADKLDSETYCDRILENVDQLIALGDKARDLESVIDQTTPRESTDLSALAACVASTVEEDFAASITVDATDEVTTPVRPSFEQALRELIENAVKHGGDSPTVTVSVERTPTEVLIQVTDNGPGLPKQEREVLEHEAETPLVHGSGLGLWLVHWIVTNHGGSVESTVTGSGTTMTLSIPHTAGPVTDSESTAVNQLAEITRARDQYHAAFDESNEAMVITDDTARILDANETAAALYDVAKSDLRGRSLSEVVPENVDFEAQWESFTANGTVRDTLTVLDATGEKRVVEYAGTANIVPGQHLIISHDITDRVRRETELRRKTLAMDNAPIGITISDPDQEDNPLIYTNNRIAVQTGYDRSEIRGRNCRFMQGPATDPETVERIRTAIKNEEQITEIIRNYRKDGTPFWNRLTIAPISDEAGRLTNYVGFQEDVTEYVNRSQTLSSLETELDVWRSVR